MFNQTSHYLAYGSTDQQTLRTLTGEYDGLLVPGTVAAFQADGTQGFVLSLSASVAKPYVIDPRTPLFQTSGAKAKPSHVSLARLLGVENTVIRDGRIAPATWDDSNICLVARNWFDFNTRYVQVRPKVFDKYAKRLGRSLEPARATGPDYVLCPYLMADGTPELDKTNDALWQCAVEHASQSANRGLLRRVVAVDNPALLYDRVIAAEETEVAVWVNNLNEMDPENTGWLKHYADTIQRLAESDGKRIFGLYGGYFAVLLTKLGLRGNSHGVGFSEHRDYRELASSGAPPPRFYVQPIHRYLNVALASTLWRIDPTLIASHYEGFDVARDPLEYEYHDLMSHSVRSRAEEIAFVTNNTLEDALSQLSASHQAVQSAIDEAKVPKATKERIEERLTHLPSWTQALST